MAAVAVFIGYRVTDLTGKVAKVLLVLGIILCICPDILMTVFALCGIRVLISVSRWFSRAVKFLAMAIGTEHALFCPVDISRKTLIFPEVFGTDTGAMAGNAVIFR